MSRRTMRRSGVRMPPLGDGPNVPKLGKSKSARPAPRLVMSAAPKNSAKDLARIFPGI